MKFIGEFLKLIVAAFLGGLASVFFSGTSSVVPDFGFSLPKVDAAGYTLDYVAPATGKIFVEFMARANDVTEPLFEGGRIGAKIRLEDNAECGLYPTNPRAANSPNWADSNSKGDPDLFIRFTCGAYDVTKDETVSITVWTANLGADFVNPEVSIRYASTEKRLRIPGLQ